MSDGGKCPCPAPDVAPGGLEYAPPHRSRNDKRPSMTEDTDITPANLPPDIWRGIDYLKGELKALTTDPGVYRMLNG